MIPILISISFSCFPFLRTLLVFMLFNRSIDNLQNKNNLKFEINPFLSQVVAVPPAVAVAGVTHFYFDSTKNIVHSLSFIYFYSTCGNWFNFFFFPFLVSQAVRGEAAAAVPRAAWRAAPRLSLFLTGTPVLLLLFSSWSFLLFFFFFFNLIHPNPNQI